MANLQVKIDDNLQDMAQAVAASMGLDLASAVKMFLTQMVRENGMPFKLAEDSVYSQKDMVAVERSLAHPDLGQTEKCVEMLPHERLTAPDFVQFLLSMPSDEQEDEPEAKTLHLREVVF